MQTGFAPKDEITHIRVVSGGAQRKSTRGERREACGAHKRTAPYVCVGKPDWETRNVKSRD